jgi:hypothetical protein
MATKTRQTKAAKKLMEKRLEKEFTTAEAVG